MDIEFKDRQEGFLGHYRNAVKDIQPAYLHYHNTYELYYFLSGKRNYLTHNSVYPLAPDWVTLARPYVVHGTNGQMYERYLIAFSEDFLSAYFSPSLIEVFREVFSVNAIPAQIIQKNPRVKELFALSVKDTERNDLKMAAIHLGELLLLLYKMVKQSPNETNTSALSSQIQEILTYISNNIKTIKTLEQVADHFFISKYHLSHQFKASTGFTFIEFLTKVKISRALHLLKNTNESVADISEACGFETPAYFCIVFKKKMNMTPLQYRAWTAKAIKSSLPTK
jgi:AraC-like DNA-binding protein